MDRKGDVLQFLKAAGPTGVGEVAAHLGISRQGAFKHLEALVARGLVETAAGEHHGPGRPGHLYGLTEAARGAFPSGHRQLAADLVTFLDQDELERFFAARAERLETEFGDRLRGRPLAERVRELGRLGVEHGHMTEVTESPDKLELKHCNCPIGDVAVLTGLPCRHELDTYRRLLGVPVERSTWAAAGDATCTYEIANTAKTAPSNDYPERGNGIG
ncbi:MAG: MarR family transcriptional regulator [Candidatus Dormibacteraeota bacterium]|nr:MarR family transcriptional regulator [Candidatus Dormibacteraeota bacterium]